MTEEVDNKIDWYILHCHSNYEDRVKETIEHRIKQDGKQDVIFKVLVPKEEVVEMRAGQKRRSERKFYPGYVLIQMVMNDDTWHYVKKIPKVLGFVGGDRPAPITATQAKDIFDRMKEGVDKPKPKVLYEPGEVVRVNDGPFADFDGVVEEVNYEKNRLRVSVLIFGRSTPVDLEFGQVEKI